MPHFGTLWMIGRNGNLFWIMSQMIGGLVERASMGNGNIKYRKKWLPRPPVFIRCRIAGLIPNLRLVDRVVIFFGIVGGIIARIAKITWKEPDHGGDGVGTPHVLGTHSSGIDRKSTRLNSSHVKISYAV